MSPIELARAIVSTPLALQEPLRREFRKLSLADALTCRAEIAACKAAKRGETLGRVA